MKYNYANGVYSPQYKWLEQPENHHDQHKSIMAGLLVTVLIVTVFAIATR